MGHRTWHVKRSSTDSRSRTSLTIRPVHAPDARRRSAWQDLRSAASNGSAVPGEEGDLTPYQQAFQQQGTDHAREPTLAAAIVHWSVDDWRTVHDTPTGDTTLGVHVADLHTMDVCAGDRVNLTFYRPDVDRWEGADFLVCVE